MALDFPSAPSVGQIYSQGNRSWRWNGVAWEIVDAAKPAARELLTAARTYYINTNGLDTNNGLGPVNLGGGVGPFKTIQKAVDLIAATLDIGGNIVTIAVADGTYGPVVLRNVLGFAAAGNLVIVGNTTTPSACVVAANNTTCFIAQGLSVTWDIKGFKVTTTTAGIGLRAEGGSKLRFDRIDFGACVQFHMYANGGGAYITAIDTFTYTISGSAAAHVYATTYGTCLPFFCAVTLTGTPNFSQAFAQADIFGFIQALSMTFTGAATGVRYMAGTQAIITSGGGGANYFPGNAAGTNDGTALYN